MDGTSLRKTRAAYHVGRSVRWARWIVLAATGVASLPVVPAMASPTVADPPGDVIFDVDAKAVLDWSVPRRFEDSWAAYNEAGSSYDRDFVNPSLWSLDLDGCSSSAVRRIEKYTFTVRQVGTSWQRTFDSSRCKFRLPKVLPAQGLYKATLTLHTDWGTADGVSAPTTRNVGIRDYLIVSMGDSLASGEGNPDVPGSYSYNLDFDWPPAHVVTNRAAQWKDRRCHRSAKSGPSLAAKAFEDADPKTSVTFVSVACSGARIDHLTSWSQDGAPAQVKAVAELLRPSADRERRAIDSLLLSAGINDLFVSSVIRRCAKNTNVGRHYEDCVTRTGIADAAETLPLKYLNLAGAIDHQLPGTKEVYINDYPIEVFEGGGCGLLGGTLGNKHVPGKGIDKVEESEMNIYGNRLNHHIESMARILGGPKFRWNFVDSLTREFLPHAYCDKPTWFTSLEESLAAQGDERGAAHPNASGHVAFSSILRRAVVRDQAASPYRRLKVTIDAVKAKADSSGGDYKVAATLWKFQSDHQGVERRFSTPRNGEWTAIPPDKGTFFLDIFRAPSSPRHAVELRMGFNRILPLHHSLSDAYGAGFHEIEHPTRALSVRYTVVVETPSPSSPVIG